MNCINPILLHKVNKELSEYESITAIHKRYSTLDYIKKYVRLKDYSDNICQDISKSEVFEVPCGKCYACLQTRRSNWCMRLEMELTTQKKASFITLTYDKEHLHGYELCKRDLQLFFKRLRANIKRSSYFKDTKIKYFAVGEYGSTFGRPHYHAILFGLDYRDANTEVIIKKSWQNGFIHIGCVTEASIGYCTKYLQKQLSSYNNLPDGRQAPFKLSSQGLGKSFLLSELDNFFNNMKIRRGQSFVNIPRQFLVWMRRFFEDNKMFNKLEELKHKLYDISVKGKIKRLKEYVKRGFKLDNIKDKSLFIIPTLHTTIQRHTYEQMIYAKQNLRLKQLIYDRNIEPLSIF